MTRLNYSAPGVYVEEIASARQPIAGVGTNTVGFIGIVPDTIHCPVANADYDPVIARDMAALRLAAAGRSTDVADAKAKATARLQTDLARLNNELNALQ